MAEISTFTMNWEGDLVAQKTRNACRWGIDSVMADCVVSAKSNHPWKNRTGILEGSIQMRQAVDQGSALIGTWGSWKVEYARWLEEGTRRMKPYPFLIPASERHYQSLGLRIRSKLEWGK